MNDEEPVDLSAMSADLTARADRVTARLAERMAAYRASGDVRRVLSRWALPAMLAAAASVGWLLASRPAPEERPDRLRMLIAQDRPVAILELMIAMEDVR